MSRNRTEIKKQFIENRRKIDSEKQGKDPQLIVFFPETARLQSRLRLCYTGIMFIHRIRITGSNDRGAWLWRAWPATSA